jgi:DNA-binding IclR family transcriptional regulator
MPDVAASGRDSMLERGVQVLQSFRPAGTSLRLSDIARRTDLPKSTVHRLIDELLRLGLLERADEGYVLGHTVFELGELVPIRVGLREAALPYMQDLYEATHETVHLGVRDDLDVLYVERIHGHAGVDVPSRVGGRLPLTCTGLGKALLAHSGEELLSQVTSRPLRRLTPYSLSDPASLRAELAAIRTSGIAYENEEATSGVGCVAAPVVVRGRAIAAISLSVPSTRQQPTRFALLAPAVKTAALALSRRLRQNAADA